MACKYSVILCTLASDGADVWETPGPILEQIASHGYDGIDVDAEPDKIPAEKFNEILGIARSLGLKVPALICAWAEWHAGVERNLASSDEATRAVAVDYTKRCVDLSATLDEPALLEIDAVASEVEYPATKIPRRVLRENFVKSAREICEYAQPRNVPIAIEPINRFEGYAGFLNSIVEARSIADEVGMGLGVLLDFFHVNIEDGPVAETIRIAGDKLKHIHLADSNRQTPGTGHIDWVETVRTLNAIGFEGYLSVDSVPVVPDWKTLLRESIGFMKNIEHVVELQESIDRKMHQPA
jgi:sugar phosphate isomerase/epimerase